MQVNRMSILIALTGLSAASAAEIGVPALRPSAWTIALGAPVDLTFETRTISGGVDAARADWPSVERLFIRGDGTQENRHDVQPDAKRQSLTLTPADSGVTMIGTTLAPRLLTISADDARHLAVSSRGDDAAGRLAIPPGGDLRVRIRASAETLIRASTSGHAPAPSAVATSKSGLAAELRPLMDPTLANEGSDFAFRAYVEGGKADGVIVRATLPDGTILQRTSDATGAVVFPVQKSGRWTVQFTDLRANPHDPVASWSLFLGSLTFETAAKGGKP